MAANKDKNSFFFVNFWDHIFKTVFPKKLDGVGPVDNRPSTNKLHHFVKKNK